MKHLVFIYYTISYSIGLPAVVIFFLAYLKTKNRTIGFYLPFLFSITLLMITVTVLRYQDVILSHPNTYPNVEAKYLYFIAESSLILTFPLFIHTLFKFRYIKQISVFFIVLYLIALGLVLSPFFLKFIPESNQLFSLPGFGVYRGILFTTITYGIILLILNYSRLSEKMGKILLLSALFYTVISLPVPTIEAKSLTPNQLVSLNTIKKMTGSALYTMTYRGGYDPILRENIYQALKLQKLKRGCTIFTALNPKGELVLARNHDYFYSPALVLFTNPPDGYASVSIVDLSFIGFDTSEKLASMSDQDRTKMLYSPYLPSDGMNEYGLTVGLTYVSKAKLSSKPDRETIFSLEAIRLMLDHAKNTAEAIQLLSKYNISFPVLPSHFLIADPSGDAAIVEFIKGKMIVTRSKEPWLAASNFLVYGNTDSIRKYTRQMLTKGDTTWDINGKSYFRYVITAEDLKKTNGILSSDGAMRLLAKVSLKKLTQEIWMTTQWSVVYNMGPGEVQVVMARDYQNPHRFKLEMKCR